MTPQQNRKTPIAFIDRTGYVTPFNGILDTTLEGWYIYNENDLKAALAQQRQLEDNRVRNEIGVIDVQYYEKPDENEPNDPTSETPEFIKNVLGSSNTIPYLQLGNKAVGGETIDGIDQPATTIIKKVTVDDLHVDPDNENLTEEERKQQSDDGLNHNLLVNQVMNL